MRALIAASETVRHRSHLCEIVHIDPANLYKYEKDPDPPPPLKLLIDIARALHVSLDQLYPTGLMAREPSHSGWLRFLESDLGRSMSPEERHDMANVRFRERVPAPELYAQLLMAYRVYTSPVENDSDVVELHPVRDAGS